MHLLWLLPLAAGLAAVSLGRFHGIALLVALACGLFGLVHLVSRPRGIPSPRAQQERDTRDVERDIPPRPG
jgi:hypothetical protein